MRQNRSFGPVSTRVGRLVALVRIACSTYMKLLLEFFTPPLLQVDRRSAIFAKPVVVRAIFSIIFKFMGVRVSLVCVARQRCATPRKRVVPQCGVRNASAKGSGTLKAQARTADTATTMFSCRSRRNNTANLVRFYGFNE
jgi:hypothetical protein